jgi:hypothetical protein
MVLLMAKLTFCGMSPVRPATAPPFLAMMMPVPVARRAAAPAPTALTVAAGLRRAPA